MTDRELLELAAKAAGLDVQRSRLDDPLCRDFLMNGSSPRNEGQSVFPWNPLTHDGDALMLAVRLNLLVLPYPDDQAVRVTRLDQPDAIVAWGMPPDPCAATRRAIVQAAAEIGKAG